MPVSLEQFIQQLQDSGILASETLQGFLPPQANPKDVEALAKSLVRKKALTEFQAREFYRGNGQSLILDNYVLLEKIGQGGMGQVFKARHRRMDRTVAIKVLPASTMKDPATVARFEREVRAASRLTHPNIVTAFDAGRVGNTHFLVMELVEGRDLSALVKQDGPLSLQVALKAILDAARGLEAAHRHGIIHRDIKPANLFLDKQGTVKILDMGLARLDGEVTAQAELTATGMIMGTVDYMAPEQALSTRTADARADVYSLGCSLYYLLTAKALYDGDTLMAKLLAHRDQPLPSVCALCPTAPQQLDSVLHRMIAKSVEARYQTMTDVIADLERLNSSPDTITHISAGKVEDAPTVTHVMKVVPDGTSQTAVTGSVNLGNSATYSASLSLNKTLKTMFGLRNRQGLVLLGATAVGILLILASWFMLPQRPARGLAVPKSTPGQSNPPKLTDPQSKPKTDSETKAAPQQVAVVTPEAKKPVVIPKLTWPAPPLPTQIADPPRLSDWLKGRKERTVAKDGSGEFKTIQEAVNALKTGEVVRVLDKGPYLEALYLEPPPDTGLVSEVGTVVESSGMRKKSHPSDPARNMLLTGADGFRLSGFAFVEGDAGDNRSWEGCFWTSACSDTVLENCLFHFDRQSTAEVVPVLRMTLRTIRNNQLPCVVRNCVFNGPALLDSSITLDVASVVTFEQNWFRDVRKYTSILVSGKLKCARIRENVIENDSPETISLLDVENSAMLEITNNTLTRGSINIVTNMRTGPPAGMTILNNLLGVPPTFNQRITGRDQFDQAAKNWYVHGNVPRVLDPKSAQLKMGDDQVTGDADFLSTEKSLPNFLRIPAVGFAAQNGLSSPWPPQLGALPPGPAPETGDWFSRLRVQWQDVLLDRMLTESPDTVVIGGIQLPKKVDEPAPFEDWLKGRKILTVSQAGKGNFSTLKAAFENLKAGQVVEILDRGPYRETIFVKGVADAGLFSRHGAIVEVNGKSEGGSPGHFIIAPDRFRIHGVMFTAPPVAVPDLKGATLMVQVTTGFVIENCLFRSKHPEDYCFLAYWPEQGSSWPVLNLRDNIFDTGPTINCKLPTPRSVTIVERNWFRNLQGSPYSFRIYRQCGKTVVRNNIFSSEKPAPILVYDSAGSGVVEVTNNTDLSGGLEATESVGPAQMIVLNNVLGGSIRFSTELKDKLPEAIKLWQVSNNVYLQEPTGETGFPRSETDYVAQPMFLSRDPSLPDYLHLPANAPEARRGKRGDWPAYLGAFPPGPPPPEGTWFSRLRTHWIDAPAPAK